jgi:hypothetical protein
MSNASTVRRQIAGTQQLTIAPLSGTVITTTKTAFALNNNGLTLTGGGTIPLSAGVTGLYQGTGQVLHIGVQGSYSGATAASTTIGLELYQVPASALPIANTLSGQQTTALWAAIGAQGGQGSAVTTATGSFTADYRLQLDAAGNLEGQYTINMDGVTVVAWTVITAVAGLVGEADLNFVLTVQLGTSTAGVIVTLNEFRLDLE